MQQIKGLYVHVSVYCIVIAGLFLINFFASRGAWWFFWPALGWGVGLAFHAFGVYGTEALFGADWEERKLREIMERDAAARAEPPEASVLSSPSGARVCNRRGTSGSTAGDLS